MTGVREATSQVPTGGIGQFDKPYLDSSSNGLLYGAEKMKSVRQFGHVMLFMCERSRLTRIAASRL